jgi:hypothetical protein
MRSSASIVGFHRFAMRAGSGSFAFDAGLGHPRGAPGVVSSSYRQVPNTTWKGTSLLTVHRAPDGGRLAEAIASVLATSPANSLAPEVVAVPAKGVERWLAQRLAHVLGANGGDGVCANVLFPSPVRMLDETAKAVSPEHALSVQRWASAAHPAPRPRRGRQGASAGRRYPAGPLVRRLRAVPAADAPSLGQGPGRAG